VWCENRTAAVLRNHRVAQEFIAALFNHFLNRLSLDNPEPPSESIAMKPPDHQVPTQAQPTRKAEQDLEGSSQGQLTTKKERLNKRALHASSCRR
jgi:hypothetical protein